MSDSSQSTNAVNWFGQLARRWNAPPTLPRVAVRLIVDAGHPTAEISLFDGNFAIVAQGVGVLDTPVPPGLYELQYKAGRRVQEVSVRVPAGQPEFRVSIPELTTRTTAVPQASTEAGRHIGKWVGEVSRAVHLTIGEGSQLFIFARLLGDQETAQYGGVFDLQLKDSTSAVIADFGKHAVSQNDKARGYTIALAPGTYILSASAGSLGRLEQAIHVAKGWQTQILLTPAEYGAERFRGADLRRGAVLMSQLGRAFNLNDPAVGWVEAAKVALFAGTAAAPVSELRRAVNAVKEARGDAPPPPRQDAPVDEMLAAKFTNPMLGILGGHLLLLQQPLDRHLLIEVVNNLEGLVPGHPDVHALRYAAGLSGRAALASPPMLRSSWELIIEHTIEHPEIVPMGSYAARIATRTWGGGTWLLWKAPSDQPVVESARAPRAAAFPKGASPAAAAGTTELMHQVLATLAEALPWHDADRYLEMLAARLSLNAAETRVLKYLAGAARQSQISTDLLSTLPSNLAERLYSSAYGLVTGRYLPKAQQVLDWVAEVRDHYVREPSVVRALGIPMSTVSSAVEHLSTLLKGELLMAPRVCFDRILPRDLNKVRPAAPIAGAQTRAAFEIAKLWDLGKTLRVRFMGGTTAQHDIVKQFAPQWADHANIKFKVSTDQNAEIRIAFVESDGAWSYIGTDCAEIPITQPTMNLGWQDEGVVLHEFGHALGLIHEHQNPVGGIQWNKPAVYADLRGPPNFWDEPTIDNNMFATYAKDQINGTSLDKRSIMLYEIPKSWTTNGFSSKANEKLSETDKKFAHNQCNYPFDGPRKQPCT